jgi:hypothetical protein
MVMSLGAASCGRDGSVSTHKDIVTVGPNARVVAVHKQGDYFLIRQCPDLTVIENPAQVTEKCTFSPSVKQRSISEADYRKSLFDGFFSPANRSIVSTSPYADLLKYRPDTVRNVSQERDEVLKKIKEIEDFNAKHPGSIGTYEQELVRLKERLARTEKLGPAVDQLNNLINEVILRSTSEVEVFYYSDANPEQKFIVSMISSIIG